MFSELGIKVRQLRLESGMSQRQLAGAEMTRAYISMIEMGKVIPSFNKLQVIALRLSRPLSVLVEGPAGANAALIETLFRTADALLEAERYDNAVEALEHALRLCTLVGHVAGRLTGLEKLGIALRKLGDLEKTLDAFEKLVEEAKLATDPVIIAQGLSHLGNTFYAMQDYLMAKRCYSRALRQIEGRKRQMGLAQEILINMGSCLIHLGHYEEAAMVSRQAISIHPQLGDHPKLACAYLGLSCAYQLSGDTEQALRMVTKSLELFENLGDKQGTFSALYTLAIWEAESGACDRALLNLRRCRDLCSEGLNNCAALVLRDAAWCLFVQNKIPEAIRICQEALSRQDDRDLHHRICELLGQCYKALGDYERAVDLWDERPARPAWSDQQLMSHFVSARASGLGT